MTNLETSTEYEVVYGDPKDDRTWHVDHVSLKQARHIMAMEPDDVVEVRKVVRKGNDSHGVVSSKGTILWTRDPESKVGEVYE